MCLGCHARACVWEVVDALHCRTCRRWLTISATSNSLRQHGDDVVSEAMRSARLERDLVRTTAPEASLSN